MQCRFGFLISVSNTLKDTLKAFDDFKNKQIVYEVMFFDRLKYVYSESGFNVLYIEMKHKC